MAIVLSYDRLAASPIEGHVKRVGPCGGGVWLVCECVCVCVCALPNGNYYTVHVTIHRDPEQPLTFELETRSRNSCFPL